MLVAYVTSRFPEVTEPWMVRELDAVASDPEIDCQVLSLFPPRSKVVHPAAEAWLPRHRRPRPAAQASALLWWLGRSPGRLLAAVALLIGGYARRPALLVRALATVPIAAAHARSIASEGVDHVHAYFATYPLLAAWLCHRLTDVPYSFTAHAHDIFIDQSFLRQRLADARFVVAISDFNREFLEAYGGGRDTPVHVVRYGIDPAAYRFRARAPAQAGPVRALCVASFKEYKGHRFLLEALAGGGTELDRVSLDLVGEGPLRERLERLVSDLGLRERVRFHGTVREAEVNALLDRADLFVLPSVAAANGQMEGLPVSLIEALGAGVPAVATRTAGVPELIRDGETGLLADPESPPGLRRAIEAALADPAAAARRAKAGRELVERNHDAGRTGPALARLFRGAGASGDGDPDASS